MKPKRKRKVIKKVKVATSNPEIHSNTDKLTELLTGTKQK